MRALLGRKEGWGDTMKQLISATLSLEAAKIYNDWEKQKKSAILSDLIVKENGNREHIIALQRRNSLLTAKLAELNVKVKVKEGLTPLVEEVNEMLIGTIYYQYWDKPSTIVEKNQKSPIKESAAEKMNREYFEKTGNYLF